ncbi:MAG: polyphosphate polymerase domain-containing protein [Eubacterium sp.]|nr:polyphosphate polymerase domain-containing protein [Eubacterium sp.]
MLFQEVFKRVEVKYLLTKEQYTLLRNRLKDIAEVDQYGETDILNIYYDTPDYQLIRRSLEKPLYKEKLRLRTYGTPKDRRETSFIEIKKKYDGVVYKRRIDAPYGEAKTYLDGEGELAKRSQIKSEIDSMLAGNEGMRPAMAISYKRIAMKGIADPELRITFDREIRWRTEDLELTSGPQGEELLQPGQYLMEVKIANAFPMELARIFSELSIFPATFSKYGRGYEVMTARAMSLRQQIKRNEHAVYAGKKGVMVYA